MRVVVAAVGSPTGAVGRAVREYEERAARYFQLERVEVEAGASSSAGAEQIKRREGERLLGRVPEELDWFALTREGKGMSSRRLARYLEEAGTYGLPGAAFLVGGAYGLSREVISRARYRLSLSPMTLPHGLARLVLAEQIYRAGTIIRGEPYHKGS